MIDDDHKQLNPRADNLPGALQRSKKTGLIATLRARIQALTHTDDDWFKRLCAWANKFEIL